MFVLGLFVRIVVEGLSVGWRWLGRSVLRVFLGLSVCNLFEFCGEEDVVNGCEGVFDLGVLDR